MWSAAIAAVLQVFIFTAVPFAVYLATRRTTRGFLQYIGLYAPERRTFLWATLLVLVTAPLLLWAFSTPVLREKVAGPGTVAGVLRQLEPGVESLVILLLYAWAQTSLSEEILFRGFVAQRLINRFGFGVGNFVQALLFGFLHLSLFSALAGDGLTPLRAGTLFLVPTAMGWALGYIKIKLGNGSIVPGWWAHGLSNCIAYTVAAFVWS